MTDAEQAGKPPAEAEQTKGQKAGKPPAEPEGPPTAPVVVTLTVGKRTVKVLERDVDLRLLGGLKGGRRPALIESIAGDVYDAVLGELRKLQEG